MTDDAATAVTEEAPEGHYYVTVKDRRILVKEINPAQQMVLGGFFRQMHSGTDIEGVLGIFGKIMYLVESLIPRPDDIAWLENGIINGTIDVPDFALLFLPVTTAETKKKPVRPRRGK